MDFKEEKKIIRQYERDSFYILKEQENANRGIIVSNDILCISDFTIQKYFDDGDSGLLYLATNKYNYTQKYILKHEYYDCACNEYMYYKIGSKMGIKIAPVKLFVLDNKLSRFQSDFVCGIKFLEDCEKVKYDDIVNHKISNWEDFFRMKGLYSLLEEEDGLETLKYNNEIYRIDTTDAFTISDYYISGLAYDLNDNKGNNMRQVMSKTILKIAERKAERISSWKYKLNYFKEKYGEEYLTYYFEAFKLLNMITEKDMEDWTNILTILYPNIIGEYFKKYVKNLKLDAEMFLGKEKEKEKTLVKK